MRKKYSVQNFSWEKTRERPKIFRVMMSGKINNRMAISRTFVSSSIIEDGNLDLDKLFLELFKSSVDTLLEEDNN